MIFIVAAAAGAQPAIDLAHLDRMTFGEEKIWRVKFCDSSAGKRTLYWRTSSAPARARRLASLTPLRALHAA